MTLRGRFVAYIAVVHLIFAALAVVVLRSHPLWLVAAELAFVASLTIGIKIGRDLFRHLGFAAEGLRFYANRNSRRVSWRWPTGGRRVDLGLQPMVDNLREERTRLREQEHFSQILAASPSGVVILDFKRRSATSIPPPSGCWDERVAAFACG